MPEVPDLVTLAGDDVTVTIDARLGARAVSWRVDGHELLGGRSSHPVEHGMYPMAPWAGRVRDNAVGEGAGRHSLPVTYDPWALHGTVLARPATAVDVRLEEASSVLVARFDDHPEWPWPMSVRVEWRVIGRVLEADIVVSAPAEGFPAVVGWHPWFRRRLDGSASAVWSCDGAGQLRRGSDHLPTGDLDPYDPSSGPFDDAFAVPDGHARVTWPGVLDLSVQSDGDWYVVFDELPDTLCIEPQSGPPDGLREAGRPSAFGPVRRAEPERPVSLRTRWTPHRLSDC
ncbi:MAG: aldose 1-epimerase [Actinomycetales bacterium]|nr:aldose 1-epimerase [Actinomycetales bacterium]